MALQYYIRIVDGQPERYSPGELIRDNPNTSFPENLSDEKLAEYGVLKVTVDPRPAYNDTTQRLVPQDPVETSPGVWTKGWTVENLTTQEIDAKVNSKVNQAVGVSDVDKAIGFLLADLWQQLNAGMTEQEARQAVRERLKTHIRNIRGV